MWLLKLIIYLMAKKMCQLSIIYKNDYLFKLSSQKFNHRKKLLKNRIC